MGYHDIKLTVTIDPDDHEALAKVLDIDDLLPYWEEDEVVAAVANRVNPYTFAKTVKGEDLAGDFAEALAEVWPVTPTKDEIAEALAASDEVDLAQIANTLGALDTAKALALAEALADILGVVA